MFTRAGLIAALTCAPLLACSGDDGPDEAGDETGNDDSADPGPPAEGWESAYVEGGVLFSCDDDETTVAGTGAPALSFGDASLYVGFEENNQQEQNPLVVRFDAGTQTYCERHETEGPNGRAEGVTWDGGDVAYVVYTIVGGGTSFETKGGWLSAYGPGPISGGGAEVSVVGQVAAGSGALDTASFFIAVDSDERVTTHSPRGAPTVLESGDVEFLGSSAHAPIDADGLSPMDCTDEPFETRYVLSPELGTLICASSSNCSAQQPCG